MRGFWRLAGLLLPGAAACTTLTTMPDPRDRSQQGNPTYSTPIEVPDGATAQDQTCLGKAGVSFPEGACTECMSAEACCQVTIDCFRNDRECAGLQTCMAGCGLTSPEATGDAGDGGDAEADSGQDAGADREACYARCKRVYAASLTKWNAYNACVTQTCGAVCL
jgi:hypothetical protein